MRVDFGAVYHHPLSSQRYLWQKLTDYAQEPVNMRRYRPDDQARIRQQMQTIAETLGV